MVMSLNEEWQLGLRRKFGFRGWAGVVWVQTSKLVCSWQTKAYRPLNPAEPNSEGLRTQGQGQKGRSSQWRRGGPTHLFSILTSVSCADALLLWLIQTNSCECHLSKIFPSACRFMYALCIEPVTGESRAAGALITLNWNTSVRL